MEHAIAINENVSENTTAAESRIRDADMAEAMVEHSKENILMQAAQSMLSQANSNPQRILALLEV
jgi:flagellin